MKAWLIWQTLLIKGAGLGVVLGTDYDLLGWAVFIFAGLLVLGHLLIPQWSGLLDVRSSFQPSGKEVWLTIDDGPDPVNTSATLDLLDAYQARATFFMIGERAERSPDLIREVSVRGHEVACHTQTHPTKGFWVAGPRRTARELDQSLKVLEACGLKIARFRSPVGIKNFWMRGVLRERGLELVAWSIRSCDGVSRDPEAVVHRVLDRLRPGAIILMHEGEGRAGEVRVEALRGVLDGLRERGYRCVLPGSR